MKRIMSALLITGIAATLSSAAHADPSIATLKGDLKTAHEDIKADKAAIKNEKAEIKTEQANQHRGAIMPKGIVVD